MSSTSETAWMGTRPAGKGLCSQLKHAFSEAAVLAILSGAVSDAPKDRIGLKALCGQWFAISEFARDGNGAPCERCVFVAPIGAVETHGPLSIEGT